MSTQSSPRGSWAPRAGYQRSSYVAAPAPAGASTWAAQPGRQGRGSVGVVIVGVLGMLGLAAMLIFVAKSAGGATHILLPLAYALVPLTIVLVAVWWIDRWEPEPMNRLLVAFLWGAGVSTAISLVLNSSGQQLLLEVTKDTVGADFIAAAVIAPIVEEVSKGLGVLVLYLMGRRFFNGAVDGIVYGAVVAGGFAFAENILYFARYADSIGTVFVSRGIASPFAHVTFTACTGLAIGISSRMRSQMAWLWMTPVGLSGAIILHAFWNGAISSMPELYLLVEVPLFLLCIGVVVFLRWKERMTMRARLADYERAGWFAPAEVTMLTTPSGRSAARRWARGQGPEAYQAMKTFLNAASALAQLRQQALDGHAEADFARTESQLMHTITVSRSSFLSGV